MRPSPVEPVSGQPARLDPLGMLRAVGIDQDVLARFGAEKIADIYDMWSDAATALRPMPCDTFSFASDVDAIVAMSAAWTLLTAARNSSQECQVFHGQRVVVLDEVTLDPVGLTGEARVCLCQTWFE